MLYTDQIEELRPTVEELREKNEVFLAQAQTGSRPLYAIFCHNCGQIEYSFVMGGSAFDFCDGPSNNEDCRMIYDGVANYEVVDLTGRDRDWTEWEIAFIED